MILPCISIYRAKIGKEDVFHYHHIPFFDLFPKTINLWDKAGCETFIKKYEKELVELEDIFPKDSLKKLKRLTNSQIRRGKGFPDFVVWSESTQLLLWK